MIVTRDPNFHPTQPKEQEVVTNVPELPQEDTQEQETIVQPHPKKNGKKHSQGK